MANSSPIYAVEAYLNDLVGWVCVVDFDCGIDDVERASRIAISTLKENSIFNKAKVVVANSDDEDLFPTVCEFVNMNGHIF